MLGSGLLPAGTADGSLPHGMNVSAPMLQLQQHHSGFAPAVALATAIGSRMACAVISRSERFSGLKACTRDGQWDCYSPLNTSRADCSITHGLPAHYALAYTISVRK